MYEHRHEPLLSRVAFLRRVARHAGAAGGVVLGSLGVGVLGYHLLAGLSWIDALVNAAMLLGGMGPVDGLHTMAAKLFAAFYALYSGLVFLIVAGLLFAPVFHRLLHHFHVGLGDEASDGAGQ